MFKVPFTKVESVHPHDNADRLEIATVYGFQVIVGKGNWKAGDDCFYIPIDSVLPQNIEDFLFPPDSKIQRDGHKRVKQINIRGRSSQGIIMSLDDMCKANPGIKLNLVYEYDYSSLFNITKYEPPIAHFQKRGPNNAKKRHEQHPLFHNYGGLDNLKWFPTKFKPEDLVQITEKLHGSNIRCGWLPYRPTTTWKRVKNYILSLFGLDQKWEWVYGSNNVQLQGNSKGENCYYGMNVYEKAIETNGLKNKVKHGELVYGEIIGWAGDKPIQKNYTYSIPKGEVKFVMFDVKTLQSDNTMKWMEPVGVRLYARTRGIEHVPVLFMGKYESMEKCKEFTLGPSVYDKNTKVREGCVVKKVDGYNMHDGDNFGYKLISEDYLKKDQSDFH